MSTLLTTHLALGCFYPSLPCKCLEPVRFILTVVSRPTRTLPYDTNRPLEPVLPSPAVMFTHPPCKHMQAGRVGDERMTFQTAN